MGSILDRRQLLEKLEVISRTIIQEPDIAHYGIPVDGPTLASKSLQSVRDGLMSGRLKVENFVETYPPYTLGYDPRTWWAGFQNGLNSDTDMSILKKKFSNLPHKRMVNKINAIIDSKNDLEKMQHEIVSVLLDYQLQFYVIPQIQLTNSYLLFGTIHLPHYLQILANLVSRYNKIYQPNEAILPVDFIFSGIKTLYFGSWLDFSESRHASSGLQNAIVSFSQAYELIEDLSHYDAEFHFPADDFSQPMITTYWDNLKSHRDLPSSSTYVLKQFDNFQLHPTMYQPLLTSAINLNNSFANPKAFFYMKKFFRVLSTLKQPMPKINNSIHKNLNDYDTFQCYSPSKNAPSPSHIEV
ncbi:hypothetical protein TRVA0_001S06502 [Trichomonascus vanleenenianus]|uniref:uncharacterized protein n=1 Tax=Trichomonascus vanleenenianus TaxID=2268995 RepID=UPI003EC994B3